MFEPLRPYVHPDDINEDYVQSDNQYSSYFEYSEEKKPDAILEIGVRRGYSIISMCLGHVPGMVTLIDSGLDGFDPQDVVPSLMKIGVNAFQVIKAKSQEFRLIVGEYDIIHIDGEHTVEGLTSDLQYSRFLAPHGWIIVDDVKDMPELMGVCNAFAKDNAFTCFYRDTFRGHAMLVRNSDVEYGPEWRGKYGSRE